MNWKPGEAELAVFRGVELLLVEDMPINREIASIILESWGVAVTMACDGAQALLLLKEKHFDIILMDIQMPGIDGYETARLIRKDHRCSVVPIVAMTAYTLPEEQLKITAAGMDDYLPKPMDQEQVFLCLTKWLKLPTPNTSLQLENNSGAVAPPPQEEVLNVREGLRRVMGNPTLYTKLLREFKVEYGASADKMEKLITEGDMETATRLVHSIKGVSANLGMRGVSLAAAGLEGRFRSGDGVSADMEKFKNAMEALCRQIDTLKLEQPEGAPAPGHEDPEEVQALIEQLRIMLRKGDFNAADLAPKLVSALGGRRRELVGGLVAAIDRFEYDKALSLLVDLERTIN
ncbi:MAG: response regulator [Nitrospinota bacterium]|nr:response regulator [Nitrospinota bacterium]